MRLLALISLFLFSFGWAGQADASKRGSAILLEIIDGETAFMVNQNAQKAWWIVGECRRPIPIDPKSGSSAQLMSKRMSEQVSLGSRQIKLQQQFRFDMASDPITVSVYSSVRGGWSPVPVRSLPTCQTDVTCRSRMELPEC